MELFEIAETTSIGIPYEDEKHVKCLHCDNEVSTSQEGDYCESCDKIMGCCPYCNKEIPIIFWKDFNEKIYKGYPSINDEFMSLLWHCVGCNKYFESSPD